MNRLSYPKQILEEEFHYAPSVLAEESMSLQKNTLDSSKDKVLIDNGLMELEVLGVQKNRVACKVKVSGILGENKGINLPNASVTLPAMSDQDQLSLEAALISKFRPVSLIIALTPSKEVSRKLMLLRGVLPLQVPARESSDLMIRESHNAVLKTGVLKQGDPVVMVSGRKGLPAFSYSVKILRVGEV